MKEIPISFIHMDILLIVCHSYTTSDYVMIDCYLERCVVRFRIEEPFL